MRLMLSFRAQDMSPQSRPQSPDSLPETAVLGCSPPPTQLLPVAFDTWSVPAIYHE